MRNVFLIGTCLCGLVAASDAPYAGKWKMNVAKSNFGDTTVSYEQLPSGEMKANMDGQTYTFKTEGKAVMTPWGITMAWKALDPKTWEATEKTNAKKTATATVKLKDGGKALN